MNPDLGPPIESAVVDVGDYRVISRPLFLGSLRREEARPFDPLSPPVGESIAGYVQYAKPQSTLHNTIARVRGFLALGVLGGTALAFLAGFAVARRAMRPIAGLTAGGTRGRPHPRSFGRQPPQARGARRGGRARGHPGGDARRAGGRAHRDRGGAAPPAGFRGRRVARAAHTADQRPRQPRAARGGAAGRAARDRRLGPALVTPHEPPGGRPAAARARRRGPAFPPKAGRPRGRSFARRSPRPRPSPASGRSRSSCPTTAARWSRAHPTTSTGWLSI